MTKTTLSQRKVGKIQQKKCSIQISTQFDVELVGYIWDYHLVSTVGVKYTLFL